MACLLFNTGNKPYKKAQTRMSGFMGSVQNPFFRFRGLIISCKIYLISKH
ncbi:hypothetical protein GCM10007358_15400 [Phocicoccus schoeneichii]|nr:hypothetical protein GCM10007358_15400 [Jeotgalicoccus schoeneichii]